MARTLDELDKIRAVRDDITATRARAFNHSLPLGDRRLAEKRLTELTRALSELELEAPAAATPPPMPVLDAKITPAQARDRAAAIRARPEFWNPHKRNADGTAAIAPQDHARLTQELREADARAAETEPPKDGAA
jgi:hypothetical protein